MLAFGTSLEVNIPYLEHWAMISAPLQRRTEVAGSLGSAAERCGLVESLLSCFEGLTLTGSGGFPKKS